LVLLEH